MQDRRREDIVVAALTRACVRMVTLERDGVPELPVGLQRR
jgi:hypothetical protein